MAQAATPRGPGLPCTPKQALALYQLLFRRPAGLGQLQAALLQIQKCQGSPPGLELSTMLLEMERSQRAQEQLLWDLELLTGAGLGLFWPPWAQVGGQRGQAQHSWSQHSQLCGRTNGDTEPLSSRLHPPPQAEDSLKQNHQLLEEGQALDPSSAPDLGKAGGSDEDPKWEGPGIAAEATQDCLEENPTTHHNDEEPGNSQFKDLSRREEGRQAEPLIHASRRPTSRGPQEGKGTQRTPGLHSQASQGLPVPQEPPKGLGSSLDRETGPQTLLRIVPPPDQKEGTPQSQSGESPQDQRGAAPQEGENGAPQTHRGNSPMCWRKETRQAQEMKSPQSGEDNMAQAREVVQGEATVHPEREGRLRGHLRATCRSPGGETSQGGAGESPGPQGRTTPRTQVKTEGQRERAAVGAVRKGTWAPPRQAPPGSEVRMLRKPGVLAALPGGDPSPAEQEVLEARLPSVIGERRGGPGDPKAWKAARPAPAEEARAALTETALQRLLELQGAAWRRHRQERERQRLRVLERLRVAGNRHRRVHPLGLPSLAQLPPQEDAAGRRRALREQLHQARLEKTRRLRALGARNTQTFQELLSSGAEKPEPGEARPPFPAPSGHCWVPRDI